LSTVYSHLIKPFILAKMRHSKNSGIVNNLVKEKFSNWARISLLAPPFSKAFRIKKSKRKVDQERS